MSEVRCEVSAFACSSKPGPMARPRQLGRERCRRHRDRT